MIDKEVPIGSKWTFNGLEESPVFEVVARIDEHRGTLVSEMVAYKTSGVAEGETRRPLGEFCALFTRVG
jgi:hypothetical protein